MSTYRRGMRTGTAVVGMALALGLAAWGGRAGGPEGASAHVAAGTPAEAGRYLIIVGGCNDCHTPGWAEANGEVPDSAWLTGAPVGFKGPWGTSYPKNLRLTVASTDEDAFVARVKAAGLPPMPWMNLARMADEDIRAMYRYIRDLGPAGDPMPVPLAPGVEPQTPYIVFEPVMPASATR